MSREIEQPEPKPPGDVSNFGKPLAEHLSRVTKPSIEEIQTIRYPDNPEVLDNHTLYRLVLPKR